MGYGLTGLDGKVAVVTGAGRMRSIGRAIAVELARAGCDVAITGTGREPARYTVDEQAAGWRDIESVADEVRALDRRAVPVVSDVSDHEAVEALAATIHGQFGRCDIVVNNASFARGPDRVPVVDLPVELWRTVLAVNLTGPFSMSQVFARRMIAAGTGGSIVNISSIGGKLAMANSAAYAAAKAGVHALTASMAKEVGPFGVRVNSICPGTIDTSRLDDMRIGDRWERAIQENIPLRRAGTGQDVARMVVYLCSDEGSWITGQQYNVDGGQASFPF